MILCNLGSNFMTMQWHCSLSIGLINEVNDWLLVGTVLCTVVSLREEICSVCVWVKRSPHLRYMFFSSSSSSWEFVDDSVYFSTVSDTGRAAFTNQSGLCRYKPWYYTVNWPEVEYWFGILQLVVAFILSIFSFSQLFEGSVSVKRLKSWISLLSSVWRGDLVITFMIWSVDCTYLIILQENYPVFTIRISKSVRENCQSPQ